MGRISGVVGVVSGLGPWKWLVYGLGGAVALTALLWAKGAYDGRIERMHSVKIAEDLENVSADTLEADLLRLQKQAKEAREELAAHRAEVDADRLAIEEREAALERERASFEARQKRALGEYTRRLGEIRGRVDAIADEDLDAEWRAAVAALEGGR